MRQIEDDGFRPTFESPGCGSCTECLEFCPGAAVDGAAWTDDGEARRSRRPDAGWELGPTLEIWEGWASDPEIRFRASSGGALSALSCYCLEHGVCDGVLHVGMDPARPWTNTNVVSRHREEILSRAGSRYGPSAPCTSLPDVESSAERYVFIGKPCDVAGLSELRRRRPALRETLPLLLSFCCAGTPSVRGTLDLLAGLKADLRRVNAVRYRGNGWPGEFTVTGAGVGTRSLSYSESWRKLTGYRPLRCHLCPDGLGRRADITCGDAWNEYHGDGDPGRSLIIVRTERGRDTLRLAARYGYLTLREAAPDNVLLAQTSLLERQRALFGRLAAFRALGVPVPSYQGFDLFRSWVRLPLSEQGRSFFGTLRRIVRRRWYRPALT